MAESATRKINVVGAAIVKDGLVLCAQRGGGGPLAGLWEFPGGKIERGEEPDQALIREIREELTCHINVGQMITTTTHAYDFATVILHAFYCELVHGTPRAVEHAELRWVRPTELHTLKWAPADIPAVTKIARELTP